MMLGVGVPGAIIYFLIIIGGIIRSLKLHKSSGNDGYAFASIVLLFFCLTNLMGSRFSEPNLLNFVIFIVLVKLGFEKPELLDSGYKWPLRIQ
jgi:hypothetical protein